MLKFFIFLSVMGTFSFYVFSRLAAHSPRPDISVCWILLAAACCVSLQFLAFKSVLFIPSSYGEGTIMSHIIAVVSWVVYTTIGAFYCMILFTVIADIAGIAYGFLSPETPIQAIHKWSFISILAFTVSSTVIGIVQALGPPTIERAEVRIQNLPSEFDGYKIVQLSDLHVGPLIHKPFVERVAKMVNALSPDMVALTGDFADGRVAILKNDLTPLNDITAPKYFIMGNHEYYWMPQEWIKLYRSMGINVLLNQHDVIRRGNSQIVVAGIEDYSQGRDLANPEIALKGAPKDATTILLAHQPSDYARAAALGVDLQLSGHTHGGQFFPWSMVVRFFHRYFTGLNQHENMWIYINRGTGFWGTPLRTFVPPEITLLTLKRAE